MYNKTTHLERKKEKDRERERFIEWEWQHNKKLSKPLVALGIAIGGDWFHQSTLGI